MSDLAFAVRRQGKYTEAEQTDWQTLQLRKGAL
jgi:hypothetical protein